tara:strand:+ start:705 stop:1895 length:1191 start_codon:yes stop_codon:yes gene_type:complete
MPAKNTPSKSAATTVVQHEDTQPDLIFIDSPGETFPKIVSRDVTGSMRIPKSVNTAATLRLNQAAQRITPPTSSFEFSGVGGKRIGKVTVFTEGLAVDHFDAYRQGKNIQNTKQFAKSILPQITVNRSVIANNRGMYNYRVQQIEYGQSSLHETYNKFTKKFIPFEDFPGKLNPVDLIKAGNYILQYMIITDLTRNVDQFINPDHLDGAIEVFEIRESFANTSFSDIRIKGLKGSLPNENYFETGHGAAPIDNKYEFKQLTNSVFDDSAETAFTSTSLFPNKLGMPITTASFAQPGFVAETDRKMSPYSDSESDIEHLYEVHLRQFVETVPHPAGIPITSSIGRLTAPELGTRFKASNRGFIMTPNYSKITGVSFADEVITNPGTDSIAFIGTSRS